jgi:hypothetical protein
MKQLSLNNLGVQELDAREMVETDGGNPLWLPAAIAFIAGAIAGGVTYDAAKALYFASLESGNHYNGSVPGFGPR